MTPLVIPLLLSLSGAIEVSDAPVKLLAMPLQGAADHADATTLFNGSIAEALTNSGVAEVITYDDIARIADLETERATMNCDVASCMAEIANALGAAQVLYGTATFIEEHWIVQLVYFDARAGRALGRREVRGSSALEVADALKREVYSLVSGKDAPDAPDAEAPESTATDWGLLSSAGVLGAGALIAAVGGIGLALAEATFVDPKADTGARNSARGNGRVYTGVLIAGAVVTTVGAGLVGWQLAE